MKRAHVLLTTGLFAVALSQSLPAADGTLPNGKNGQPLNLDFETGTLNDWVAVGAAFEKQPVRGDTVSKRRSDMKSQHQGEYWIGGYELVGDDPQGTLTSVSFKVTQPWCSFLFAAGNWPNTRVELVRADKSTCLIPGSTARNGLRCTPGSPLRAASRAGGVARRPSGTCVCGRIQSRV
jgi:hypothetical protein